MEEDQDLRSLSIRVFTIGHSNRPLESLIELLKGTGIAALADIRRFPGSRAHPHFNREPLAASLSAAGIRYHWIEALGGRRSSRKASPSTNLGLRNASFRAYADYMATPGFQAALGELLDL